MLIYQKSIYLLKRGFPNGDIVFDDNAPGIFGPLTCSFLFVSALQKPGSDDRLFWPQSWKNIGQTIMIPIGLFEAQQYFYLRVLSSSWPYQALDKRYLQHDSCNSSNNSCYNTVEVPRKRDKIWQGFALHSDILPFFHGRLPYIHTVLFVVVHVTITSNSTKPSIKVKTLIFYNGKVYDYQGKCHMLKIHQY